MPLIVVLDLIVIAWLAAVAMRKGFDEALPVAAFLLLLFPNESQIQLPGLFDLTTQRVIVLTLFGLYLFRKRGSTSEQPARLPLRYLLAALVCWMLFSSANSVVPVISFKTSLSQCLDFCIPYLIFARLVSRAEAVQKIFTAFVTGMFVCSFFGLIEIYMGWSVTSLFPALPSHFSDLVDTADRGSRMHSTFGHAILFGAALSLTVPMALYLLTTATTTLRKAFLWSATAVMLFCVYKTGSRGPWIAILLSLVLLMLLGQSKMRRNILILAALAALMMIVRPGIKDSIFTTYSATLDPDSPEGQSYQWRYVLYDVAHRELAKDTGRSLWGYGPESFYYLGLTTDAMVDGEIHHVKVESCDSSFVALMMETGYVGFGIVVLLLLTIAFQSLRSYLISKDVDNSFYLVLFVNICAFSFLMSNVELWGWGQQSYMIWVITALAMIHPRLHAASESEAQLHSAYPQISQQGQPRPFAAAHPSIQSTQ